jgi:hypothetical protein
MSAIVKSDNAPVSIVPTEQDAMLALIERVVTNPQADVTKLEKILELRERMRERAANDAFNTAMASAQTEMRPVATDASNPQTRSRYASHAALDSALRPIYTKHGLSLTFDTGDSPLADHIRAICLVTHTDGHERVYHLDMPNDGKGAKGGDVMTKTHATGAAISYAMRYLLRMVFNVAVGEDDRDGNTPKTSAIRQKPDGYDAFVETLESAAMQGYKAFQAAWKDAKGVHRQYLNDTDLERIDRMRSAAKEADQR